MNAGESHICGVAQHGGDVHVTAAAALSLFSCLLTAAAALSLFFKNLESVI